MLNTNMRLCIRFIGQDKNVADCNPMILAPLKVHILCQQSIGFNCSISLHHQIERMMKNKVYAIQPRNSASLLMGSKRTPVLWCLSKAFKKLTQLCSPYMQPRRPKTTRVTSIRLPFQNYITPGQNCHLILME